MTQEQKCFFVSSICVVLKAFGVELDLGNFLTILLTHTHTHTHTHKQIGMFPRNPQGALNLLLWNSLLSYIDMQVLGTEKTDGYVAT